MSPEQHQWLRPGWTFQPTRIGYCSNTNRARRFLYEDNNVGLIRMQPHYYRVQLVRHSGVILVVMSKTLDINPSHTYRTQLTSRYVVKHAERNKFVPAWPYEC